MRPVPPITVIFIVVPRCTEEADYGFPLSIQRMSEAASAAASTAARATARLLGGRQPDEVGPHQKRHTGAMQSSYQLDQIWEERSPGPREAVKDC